MRKPPKNSDEDKDIFQQAMRGVRPLKKGNYINLKRQPVSPPQKNTSTDLSIPDFLHDVIENTITAEQVLEHAMPGIQQRVMRKLRQGDFTIEATLDLHGKTIISARKALLSFLKLCNTKHFRYVCIVHGKGKGSVDHFPILKNQVNYWLQQCSEVLAFCSAKHKDGGTGAVYILLKSS